MGGRLFWKFFFAFWLALLVAGVGAGVAVWSHRPAERVELPVALGGPPALVVQSGAAVLSTSGVDALRPLLAEWRASDPFPLHVVGPDGSELLGRMVSAESVALARQLAADADPRSPAREVELPGSGSYLLFVPSDAVRVPPGRHTGGPPAGPAGDRPPRRGEHGHGAPPPPLAPWVLILSGLVASVLFSALLAWYLAKPVRYLRRAFTAAAAGDLDTRVQPLLGDRRDEIADLGCEFDRMAAHLKALMDAQRRLFHDVSHELRSPLARLQAATGLARQEAAQVPAALDRIEQEASRMDRLIGELLTLARLQSKTPGAAPQTFDLFELVEEIAADAAFEAGARGGAVESRIDGSATLLGDPELIGRAIENVARNALKFSGQGQVIGVEARCEGNEACVTVTDCGPGVPPSQLKAIFEPFFRGGERQEGYGLGLAIAREAVAAHGGTLRARNRAEGGLAVEIRVPLAPAG